MKKKSRNLFKTLKCVNNLNRKKRGGNLSWSYSLNCALSSSLAVVIRKSCSSGLSD